jgi:hypothetical protein
MLLRRAVRLFGGPRSSWCCPPRSCLPNVISLGSSPYSYLALGFLRGSVTLLVGWTDRLPDDACLGANSVWILRKALRFELALPGGVFLFISLDSVSHGSSSGSSSAKLSCKASLSQVELAFDELILEARFCKRLSMSCCGLPLVGPLLLPRPLIIPA